MPPQQFHAEVPAATVAAAPERALLAWSRRLLLAGVVLSLLFIAPSAYFPVASAKFALMATFVALAFLALTLGGGAALLARSRGRLALGLTALLPVVYLLSYWFSTDRSMALLGVGSETDTVLFVLLSFLALASSFIMMRGSATRTLLYTVAGTAIAALVFQYLHILVGFPGEVFADKSVNLIGKWNDFALLLGVLAVFSMGSLELMALRARSYWGAWIALVLSLLMLGVTAFSTGWWMLLAAAVLIASARRFFFRDSAPATRLPWAALLLAVVSVLFLFFGTQLNTALTTVFKASSLEVRPALSTTVDIGKAAHPSMSRSLIGSGPNTFNEQWLSYKPTEVNQTQFWSVDFANGFSLLSTAYVTVGYAGVIAWLLPLLLVLLAIFRALRSATPADERTAALLSGLAAVYLWVAMIVYGPSPVIVLLAFVLAGAALGAGAAESQYAPISRMRSICATACLVALLLLAAWSAFSADRRFLSYYYSQQALTVLQSGDLTGGAAILNRSLAIERTGDNLRLGTEASLAQMASIVQSTSTPAADAQQQFSAAVSQAVNFGQAAMALNPKDYRPYLELASVYGFLASLKVEGALQQEMAAYEQAQALNQKNPAIPLLRAQLEAQNPAGSASAVETYLTQSLQLKSNYTDALLFAVQLAVAQNNLQLALQAQSAAVASAPDQSSLWYQLGLLYYVGGDMKNATAALEKALSITPNYANAQYFLGLSYYRDGNTQGAVAQFNTLTASNPDNTSVKQILNNLQAGKDPLAGLATSTPGAVPKK